MGGGGFPGGVGRARGVYGEFGGGGGGARGRRGPIYRENEPPFRRKRLILKSKTRVPKHAF